MASCRRIVELMEGPFLFAGEQRQEGLSVLEMDV